MYKLGKLPAREGAVKLKLANYLDTTKLPKVPANFGHDTIIGSTAWQMLGNDKYGDCVWAGQAHAAMQWNAEQHSSVAFSDQNVLSDYSAATGFNPNDPNSDKGTDMQAAASYFLKTGILDAAGKRHQIGAYLAIKPGDLTGLYYAIYLFNGAGIGINFPSSAMDQFNAGKNWSVVSKSAIEGGHYVWGNRRKSGIGLVTWGKEITMTLGFYSRYNDETLAYISPEYMKNGATLEGFNLTQLQADLKVLQS